MVYAATLAFFLLGLAANANAAIGPGLPARTQRAILAGDTSHALQPQFALRFTGQTGWTGFPAMKATFNFSPENPDMRAATIVFPPGELLAFRNLNGVCATERFASGECVPNSRRGWFEAWSPLLESPIQASVYLRQSTSKLPVLAAHIDDQADLVGHVDTHHARFRIRLEPLPNLPISRLVLHLQGGSRGLFENGESLCASRRYASATFSNLTDSRRTTVRSPIKLAC